MRFELRRPCPECPFADIPTAVRHLRARRVAEIAGAMLESQGSTFACHNTVDYSDATPEETDGWRPPAPGDQHCAGALIFALKQDCMTQMMRIAERLGWDATALMQDEAVVASIYDSVEDMIAGQKGA
jgi:hypothetical protein